MTHLDLFTTRLCLRTSSRRPAIRLWMALRSATLQMVRCSVKSSAYPVRKLTTDSTPNVSVNAVNRRPVRKEKRVGANLQPCFIWCNA